MTHCIYHLLTKVNHSRPQKGKAMVRGLAALAMLCAGLMTSAGAQAQGAGYQVSTSGHQKLDRYGLVAVVSGCGRLISSV